MARRICARRVSNGIGGRLVVNVGSLENVLAVRAAFQAVPGESRVRIIQLSLGTDQFDRLGLEAMNPTFLLSFLKLRR